MARVRIWISGVDGIRNVFLIQEEDGSQYIQPLKGLPNSDERIGTMYEGEFCGYPGLYFDLPRGFPTTDLQAELRLADPSIPKAYQKLIRDNFPLQTIRREQVSGAV